MRMTQKGKVAPQLIVRNNQYDIRRRLRWAVFGRRSGGEDLHVDDQYEEKECRNSSHFSSRYRIKKLYADENQAQAPRRREMRKSTARERQRRCRTFVRSGPATHHSRPGR